MLVEHLTVTREERVLRITLNRPADRNLITGEVASSMLSLLAAAEEDWTVGAVLLDASGTFFSAGLDPEVEWAGERLRAFERLMTHGIHATRPLVAAVQGPCLDAAVGLVANAHIAVAAQGVQFGLTEIRYGSWPFASFPAISRAIGARRTVALAATGRVFSATEALQFGLVQETAPPFELEDRAMALAQLLANSSQDALRRGLEFTWEQHHMNFDAAARFGSDLLAECARTPDCREGVRALREQRKPVWPSLGSS